MTAWDGLDDGDQGRPAAGEGDVMDAHPGCGECSCADQAQQVSTGIRVSAGKDRG